MFANDKLIVSRARKNVKFTVRISTHFHKMRRRGCVFFQLHTEKENVVCFNMKNGSNCYVAPLSRHYNVGGWLQNQILNLGSSPPIPDYCISDAELRNVFREPDFPVGRQRSSGPYFSMKIVFTCIQMATLKGIPFRNSSLIIIKSILVRWHMKWGLALSCNCYQILLESRKAFIAPRAGLLILVWRCLFPYLL